MCVCVLCVCDCVDVRPRVFNVCIIKTIEQASEKAMKLKDKGDLKGAEKQWNIVVDKYESGDDGVVVSEQAVYRSFTYIDMYDLYISYDLIITCVTYMHMIAPYIYL